MLYVVLVVAGDSEQNNRRTRLSYHIERVALLHFDWLLFGEDGGGSVGRYRDGAQLRRAEWQTRSHVVGALQPPSAGCTYLLQVSAQS